MLQLDHTQTAKLDEKMKKLAEGFYTHVFCTVEQFVKPNVQDALKAAAKNNFEGIVVVDECHVVTEWEAIKPAYKDLGDVRINYPKWPFILMSATVTPKDQGEIIKRLSLGTQTPVVLRGVCNRPNIYYVAARIHSKNLTDPDKWESTDTTFDWVGSEDKSESFQKDAEAERAAFWEGDGIEIQGYKGSWRLPNQPINTRVEKEFGRVPRLVQQIVRDLQCAAAADDLINFPRVAIFCRTKAECQNTYRYIYTTLTNWGNGLENCDYKYNDMVQLFVSNTTESCKSDITRSMQDPNNPLRIIVCTKAFGLGIDIPNIYLCIHWGCPTTLSQFAQESGRAARNGALAYSVLYWATSDLTSGRVAVTMTRYVSGDCRRKSLMQPFNPEHSFQAEDICVDGRCCDLCTYAKQRKEGGEKLSEADEKSGSGTDDEDEGDDEDLASDGCDDDYYDGNYENDAAQILAGLNFRYNEEDSDEDDFDIPDGRYFNSN